MASWRDSTPDAIQNDLDGLFGMCLDAAEHFLTKNGEFMPFAFAVNNGGEAGMKAAGEDMPASDMLDLLIDGMRSEADENRAVGFVVDVAIAGGDAVRVNLEHRDGGPALELISPYKISRFKKELNFAETSVAEGSRRVWPPTQGAG